MPRAAFISICISLAFVTTSAARIINIPDDNRTIQAGINASQNGDTVLVQPGVYEELLRITNRTVTLASLFLLNNDPAMIEQTILDGGGHLSVVQISGRGNRSVLCGFSIRHGLGQGAAVNVTNASPTLRYLDAYENEALHGTISCSGVENVRWNNISIHDNHSATAFTSGLLITETTSLTLTDAIIRNNSAQGAGALYLQFPGRNVLTLERAEISGNSADNESIVEIQQGGDLTLRECICFDNMGGEAWEAVRTWLSVFQAEKSIFAGTGERGNPICFKTADFPPRNHRIYNCTFIGYNDVAIDCGHGLTDVKSSIFWGNGANVGGHQVRGSVQCDYSLGEGFEGADNMSTDPLFVDPDNGDYHLRADSPCIDVGDPDVEDDPDGTRTDMGAFYFHQKDIDIRPVAIVFPAIPWETLDSQAVEIRNTGGNDLHLTTIHVPLHPSFFFFREEVPFDSAIVIPPDSTYILWIFYHPQWEGRNQAHPSSTYRIESDDPDEQLVELNVTSEPMTVPSDNFQSSIFNLQSAYPNPFNSATTIRFATGPINRGATTLSVYGLDGRLVGELWTGRDAYPPGEYSVVWNAEGLPGGVYLLRLESGEETRTMKTILLR